MTTQELQLKPMHSILYMFFDWHKLNAFNKQNPFQKSETIKIIHLWNLYTRFINPRSKKKSIYSGTFQRASSIIQSMI